MKRIGLIALGVLVLLGIVLALRPAPLEVDTAEATRMTVREYVIEEAKTRLIDQYVASMPFTGTVERIAWDVGDAVEANTLLARLDVFPLEQEIRSVDAGIEQALAQMIGVDMGKPRAEEIEAARMRMLELRDAEAMSRKDRSIAEVNAMNAQREYNRLSALREQGAVSQAAYDEAERNYNSLRQQHERAALAEDAAEKARIAAELAYRRKRDSIDDNEYQRDALRAEVAALEAKRDLLEYDQGRAEIRSPIDGYIIQKEIEDRKWLAAGTPLLLLGDPKAIEIESDILSEEIGPVYVGAQVEITGKAVNDAIVPGTVSRIYPSGFMKVSALGIEQQRVRTIVSFENDELRLRPEVSLDVHIVTAESPDTIAVPERAVFRRQDEYAVFAVKDGRAILTPVEIGLRNDDWAEIVSGLDEGDIVVADPDNDLDDGIAVRPR